jgi:dsRNA-specific ribonuclease
MSHEYNDKIEEMLEQFMQRVVEKKFGDIEKHVKKAENKLRRLQLVIKDKDEEHRSIRNISEHRIQRSKSRNKRDYSPMTNPNLSSVPRGPRKTLLAQNLPQ